jgi:hypothetical protein
MGAADQYIMAPLLGGRGVFGNKKKTRSEMEVGSSCVWHDEEVGVDVDVDIGIESSSSMEKDELALKGNGRSSVYLFPLISGTNSVMTGFPGRMRPNG